MKKLKKGIKWILAVALVMLIVTGTEDVPKAYAAKAANLTVEIDTGDTITLEDTNSDGYYEINTADKLYAFAAAVNAGNTSINGELTANITVNTGVLGDDGELASDIDTGSFREWTPIDSGYQGIFEGNNHTISGLYISSDLCVGLFGRLYGEGIVQNLGVKDSYFWGSEDVGSIVGQNRGTITNCFNAGSFSGGSLNIGGVVGYNWEGGIIKDCYNSGKVNGGQYVGGIVGYSDNNESMVANCYNTGTIFGITASVGGIAGINSEASVLNCYNNGNISTENACNLGGVVGENVWAATVTNCYNTGSVSSNYIGSNYLGGVIGKNDELSEVLNCFYLKGCAYVAGNKYVGIGSYNNINSDVDDSTKVMENSDFSNGRVAYLLQEKANESEGAAEIWGQTLTGENKDAYPVFASEGNKVYYGYVSCADDAQMVYTNDSNASGTQHDSADANLDGCCDVCKTSIYGVALRGSTLTLNGNIGLNFYFELDEARKDTIWANETALIRFNLADGRVINVPVNEGQEDTESVQGTTLYKYTCELYAKQMADVVVVQVIIDEQVIAQYKHSVVNYAKVIIANADGKYSEDAIRLVKAMLNYGANAQINFGYNYDAENPETLANAQLKEAEKSLDAVTVDTLESYKASGMEVDGLGKFAGSNLVLESETTLNVYFEPLTGITLNDLTFTVDGEDIAATQSGKYLVISIKNIKANGLDNSFDISVTNGTINGTFQCSVFAYCYSVLNDTEGTFTNELKNTVKALYLYNAAAN